MIRRVAVYCGSKEGDSPRFMEAAAAFGAAMAKRELDLVYGGAANGLMGAVASAVLLGGRHVIGVIPSGLGRQEWAHPQLSEAIRVDTMHERKQLMIEKADAFIALPGGFGTMDELFEAATLIQTKKIEDFPLVLMGVDYWRPLLAFLQSSMVEQGTIDRGDLDRILVTDDVVTAVAHVMNGAKPHVGDRLKPPKPHAVRATGMTVTPSRSTGSPKTAVAPAFAPRRSARLSMNVVSMVPPFGSPPGSHRRGRAASGLAAGCPRSPTDPRAAASGRRPRRAPASGR